MKVSGDEGSHVLKFGGTALDGPRRLRRAVRIVVGRADGSPGPAVVVSALTGVTDTLQRAAEAAAGGGGVPVRTVERIAGRHRSLLDEVSSGAAAAEARRLLDRRAERLGEALGRVASSGRCVPSRRDEILSFGERLCAPVVAAALREGGASAEPRTARRLLRTTEEFGRARLEWTATVRAVRERLDGRDAIQVVPGFVAASSSGRTTTLGRGGSDLTAVALGAALGAERVEIWTDVDGVMTADPSLVPDGRTLASIGWREMWLLSRYGADVLQARAAWMARRARLPLRVRNASRPAEAGTRVGASEGNGRPGPALGVASRAGGLGAWSPPVAGANGDGTRHGPVELPEGAEAGRGEAAVVAVVGVRDPDGARRRVRAALDAESVPVRALGGGPDGTLTLTVAPPDRGRAVTAIHGTLFERDSRRRMAETGGAR